MPDVKIAGAHRVGAQQCVIDAAKTQTDDENDGQLQRHGEISHVEARAERHSKSAGAFDHDAIGSAGQFLIRRTQPREADGHARFVRCDVRRNCGLETIWVRELTRRGDIARCLQRQDVVIHQPVIT